MSRAAAMNEALKTARVAGRVKQAAALAEEDSFEAKIIPQNLTSAVVYDGLLNGADLEYVVGETSLKENIIVNEPAASYVYDFLLDTGGLSPNLTDAGNIRLRLFRLSVFDAGRQILQMVAQVVAVLAG